MLKKITLISSLVATGLTFAAAAPVMSAPSNPFNGFYIGAGLGANKFRANNSLNITNNVLTFNYTHQSVNDSSAFGQINLGYDYAMSHWVVGGQLFGNLNNLTTRGSIDSTDGGGAYTANSSTKLTSQFDVGLALRAGYQWHSNLFYLLAGPQITQFQSKTQTAYNDLLGGTVGTGISNQSLTRTGFLIGGGVEQALTSHLRLSEQVTYVRYPDLSFHGSYDLNTPGNTYYNSSKYSSVSKIGAMLGLSYQF